MQLVSNIEDCHIAERWEYVYTREVAITTKLLAYIQALVTQIGFPCLTEEIAPIRLISTRYESHNGNLALLGGAKGELVS